MQPLFEKILNKKMLAYAVLAAGIALSVAAFRYEQENAKEKERLRFETVTKQATLLITTRMDAYRHILYAGAGLYSASDNVERSEWRTFVDMLRIERSFPGIQGLGYAAVIEPSEVKRHEAAMRAEGFVDYALRPSGQRESYTAIVYLEPLDQRNRRAIGYDMFSEQVRREAMVRAAVTGVAAASGKVRLMQENRIDEQAGFLMYVPVYAKGARLETKAQRLAALQGFVYAPFRVKDLMWGVLGDRYKDLAFEIYDGAPTKENLLLSKHMASVAVGAPAVEQRIDVDGRVWTLRYRPLHGFIQEAQTSFPWLVLLLGTLLSLTLFAVIRSLIRTKEKAQQLAEKITERLSISEERLRFVLEGSGDGIWDWNMETNEVFFSKRWKEMLGFGEEEISNTLFEWEKRVHPEDIDRVYRDLQLHLDGKTDAYTNEHRIKCKDGSYKWIFDRGIIVGRDRHGRPSRMVGSHADIHERKQIEESLKAERDYSANIIKETPIFVVGLAPDGTCNFVNPAGERISGYSAAELIGRNWWETFHPGESYAHIESLLHKLSTHADVRDYEMVLTRKDGEERIIAWNSLIRSDANGECVEYIGFGYDITERKRVEAELMVAKEQAETANIAKSQFLANMSHEIRTPMNAVLGLSQLMFDSDLNPKQRDCIQKIYRSSKMLLEIINDILDYSKIEADKLELEEKSFALENVLSQLNAIFAQRAEEQGITLDFGMDGDVPGVIVGDELRLDQILTNLLSNALKFTHKGKVSLTISLRERRGDRALIRFSVADTGIGMNESHIAKLFIPFSQADTSITRKYGGTGLGLTISRRLVNAMGGDLSVESRKGAGSTFSFDIDVAVSAWDRETVITPDRESPQGLGFSPMHEQRNLAELGGLHVLLAEDNLLNQEVVSMMLGRVGIVPTIARNGKEAVELFLSDPRRYDLLLMDLQMPIMSGYEATGIIRQYDTQVPIVALTAAAMIEDREKVLEAGMNDHLAKPIDMNDLYATIAKWSRASEGISSAAERFSKRGSENEAVLDEEYLHTIASGRKERIHQLLSMFLAQLEGEFADLGEKVRRNDWEARASVHALKGVSGNIGAAALCGVCTRIDAKYKRSENTADADADALQQAMAALRERIREYLQNSAADPVVSSMDAEAFNVLFAKISDSLKERNLVSPDEQRSLSDALQERVDSEELREWKDAMDNFELQRAYEIMQRWSV
ncbi:MAG: CHASE domain-containing protein [Campylobacterota bacterium]